MGQVLKLVVNNDGSTAANESSIEDKKYLAVLSRVGGSGVDFLGKVLTVVRYGVFYLLMWLRILVSFVCTVCAAFGLIALVILAFIKPEFDILWKVGAFSFSAFMFGWLYDGLLLWISPEAMMIDGRPTDEMQQ